MKINLIFLLPSLQTLPARVLTKEKSNFSSIISAPTRGKMKNIYYQLQSQPFEVAREIINKSGVAANLSIVCSLSIDPHRGFVYARKITFHSSVFCSNLLELQLARKADEAHFVSENSKLNQQSSGNSIPSEKKSRPTFKSGKNEPKVCE